MGFEPSFLLKNKTKIMRNLQKKSEINPDFKIIFKKGVYPFKA